MKGTTAAAEKETTLGLAPFSMKDAPAFIEAQFPVGRLSAESYKERKANLGQTLTALGTYWKGRKPLILVRAVVLGCLLPATADAAKDLEVFLKLMAMDDDAFGRRFNGSAADFARLVPASADRVSEEVGSRRRWRSDLSNASREAILAEALATLPYTFDQRLKHALRPEECGDELLAPIWREVNAHIGTSAQSLPQLIEQLGIARFGARPKLADAFCGGGSIPFEAARMGCDVYASDLNPVACMLTWGAFNIIGADATAREEIEVAQRRIATSIDAELTRLGIEHDSNGNRAKAFLYCVETRCPKTGWMVPMAPSWVISKARKAIGKLVPDNRNKRYLIEIHSDVSATELLEAENGTIRDGRLVHPVNPERSGVEIKTIRGDYRDADGVRRNRLRWWAKSDFIPRPDDIFQERLYCIQWMTRESLDAGRPETFFAAPTDQDLARERDVEAIVRGSLARWQDEGVVPDMPIEPGDETTRLFRERGWTHWHHLFFPRALVVLAFARNLSSSPHAYVLLAKTLDYASKCCRWVNSPGVDAVVNTFDNQALNVQWNPGLRAWERLSQPFLSFGKHHTIETRFEIDVVDARDVSISADLLVSDPPYADAISYHEITEFFIAWLRKHPPSPFDRWTWDSQRDLAIKGKHEEFRRAMVAAYAAMTKRMPDNGLQVVMFTHQDAEVWADLGGILWASGLRVTAAWNVVTEKEKQTGEGNYVQGTVCLILRKRFSQENARRMEIESEIEDAVSAQLGRLTALDEAWMAETLYTDGDLTLAAYAAALQVVTSYSTIDRQPLDRDLYRKLAKNERTMIRDLVDYAAQVANGLLVPADFPRDAWRDLGPSERFYVRMLDMEAKGTTKVADFQNFAKSFALGDYASLMGSTVANAASLAGAADLKGRILDGDGFAKTPLRQVLFAVWKTLEKGDPKLGVTTLRVEYAADYWQRRQKLIGLAEYVAAKTKTTRPQESDAAHELAEALKLDRV